MTARHQWQSQTACVCVNASGGSWRRVSLLLTQSNAGGGGVHSRSSQQNNHSRTPHPHPKSQRHSLLLARPLPGRAGSSFQKPLTLIEVQRMLGAWSTCPLASSPGLSSSCCMQEEEGRADGWFADGLRILPGHGKRGDCCSCRCCEAPAPTEDCAQLGD